MQNAQRLGAALKTARDDAGMSRREVARYAETSHQTVGSYETGSAKGVDLLCRVAAAVGHRVTIVPDE